MLVWSGAYTVVACPLIVMETWRRMPHEALCTRYCNVKLVYRDRVGQQSRRIASLNWLQPPATLHCQLALCDGVIMFCSSTGATAGSTTGVPVALTLEGGGKSK